MANMRESIRVLALCLSCYCAILALQPAAVSAQVPFPGSCPKVKLLEEFDLDAYTGVWFEHSKYPFIFEIGKKCIYARYDNLGNDTVGVLNVAVSRFSNSNSSIRGTAKVLGPGQLAVLFNSGPSTDTANYIVLGTDYASYALVYSCVSLKSIAHTRIVWILTRERNASDETVAQAKRVMVENNLSQTFLMDTLQEADCPAPITANGDDQAASESLASAASLELQLDPASAGNAETNIIEQA